MAIFQILLPHRGICSVLGLGETKQKMLLVVTLMWLSVATVDGLSLQYNMNEETSANTTLGNILTDTDLSQRFNSSITSQMQFSILKGAYAKYFTIPPGSQTLKTSDTPLDRDVICPKQPTCVIQLDMAISEPIRLFEIINTHITIADMNDNAPDFPNPDTTIYISENTKPGVPSILPIATDQDSGDEGIISYALFPESPTFSLEYIPSVHGSPEIRLILGEKLDREMQSEYNLQIRASDGGNPSLSNTLILSVIVTDTNDNFPIFDESLYNVSIPENYPLSTPIVTLHATDQDIGDNGAVVYSFSAQTLRKDGAVFSIDANTGDLFLLTSLDYEVTQSYHLTVLATDKGPDSIPATARILVHVKDVNDVMPHVTVNVLTSTGRAEVEENKTPGEFVVHVSVEDLDGGTSGEVTCNISNTNRFTIDRIYANEFKVLTNASFDRETEDTATVTISCTDKGRPPLSSSETIEVNILDQNDNIPRFTQNNYTTSVRENSTFPSPIFYVSATDTDLGPNANVTYSLDTNSFLKMDAKSGLVSTNTRLDRETTEDFMLKVYAVDQGSPKLTGTANIRVLVDDINDEAPYFTQDPYVFGTFENQAIGTQIGQVIANDDDIGPHAKVVYTFATESVGKSIFKIHPETGRISTKRIMDREEAELYILKIMATNTVHPYFSATCTVSIHIADKNDHAPTIIYPTKTNNSIHISAYARKGTPITRLLADDIDQGKNAQLVFQFAKGNEDKVFSVNPASGEVILQEDLDGTEHAYPMLVVVQDQGSPKKTSVANLYIIVNNTIGVPINSIGDTKVGRVVSGTKTELTMEVTIVIIVGCLSVVLAGSLSALLVFLCRRYRRPDPKNKTDGMMYSGVRRAPEDGMEELTVTPLTSVTLAESLEQNSPEHHSDRLDMWISDANKIEEVPHLDSGHGSWAESGSDCGTIALDYNSTVPRGYFRRPIYPEGMEPACRPDQYKQIQNVAASMAGQCPKLQIPSPQPQSRPGSIAPPGYQDVFATLKSDTYPRPVPVRPPCRPAVPPRRTVFIPGPPPPLEPHSPQKNCYSIDDLMKLTGSKLNVVKNQFSESESDTKSQGSRFDSFNSGLVDGPDGGSRQSSFSSGKSQELKPLTGFQSTVPELIDTKLYEQVDEDDQPKQTNSPDNETNKQSFQIANRGEELVHAPCLAHNDAIKYGESDC